MQEEIYNDWKVKGEEIMDLPGFRFYPTEEELLSFYLKKRVTGCDQLNLDIIIPTVQLYHYDPWELPGTLIFYFRFFPDIDLKMNFQLVLMD